MKTFLQDILQLSKNVKIFFILGLVLRLFLIFFLEPFAQVEWFIPFISNFYENFSIDPWTSYYNNYAELGFPYGIIMLFSLIPISLFMNIFCGLDAYTMGLGIKFTILFFDILCFCLIIAHIGNYRKNINNILVLYWFSPLVIVANYWAGQLDIIPITILFASFFAINKRYFKESAILLACAISAKMSMLFALPFIFIYFYRNSRMQPYAQQFFMPFVVASLILLIIPLSSLGYHEVVLGTKELLRLFDLSFSINNAYIYITPIILTLTLYAAWSMPYLSYSMLSAFIALTTLIIILTTQTPPGWFIWCIPFLLLHLSLAGIFQKLLGFAFFCIIGISQIIFWELPSNVQFSLIPIMHGSFIYSIFLTLILIMGLILINGILRDSFYKNETFRFGRKPISIGIAGDSGAGKDTLAHTLVDLFGKSNTLHISGDDYHLWDRKSALWNVMTHLDPRANNIKQFYNDVNSALDKKTFTYRHYQHSNGCFSAPIKVKTKNFCIISGLHTLLQKGLCERYDVKIFLEMEENLRAFLKCKRDSTERNHTVDKILESLAKRSADSKKYILPQEKNADIVFSLSASTDCNLTDLSTQLPPLLLSVRLRNALYYEELSRYLIATCGLNVNIELIEGMDEVILEIDGDISNEDIENFAIDSIPEIEELIAIEPKWANGLQGIMQIIIILQLIQTLKVNR